MGGTMLRGFIAGDGFIYSVLGWNGREANSSRI